MDYDYNKSMEKVKNFYAIKPESGFYLREFAYFTLERWQAEGNLKKPEDVKGNYMDYVNQLFGFDSPYVFHSMWGMGWCEAPFYPEWEDKVLEDRGEKELVQDFAGRAVLFFKGRRNGFMPEYVTHPVRDMKTWEEDVAWRLDCQNKDRLAWLANSKKDAAEGYKQGKWMQQMIIGPYMYLRSMIGPTETLYMFYDDPELIHTCMRKWLELADFITAEHQKVCEVDELSFAEDICYKTGPLISKDMIREFLVPYYQQLIANTKKRQKKQDIVIAVDSDGYFPSVIDVYKNDIGVNYMSPFEVASNCDVVEVAKQNPDLRILGGIDKRILATTKDAIDRHLDYILPYMYKRGGYIPTCDHGVPEEVSFENYVYYRKKIAEYSY